VIAARWSVERRGRLVSSSHRGIADDGAGDRDALALAPDSVSPRSPTGVSYFCAAHE